MSEIATIQTPLKRPSTPFKIIYFFRSKNGRKKNRDFIKGGRGWGVSPFYEVISQKIFNLTNVGFPRKHDTGKEKSSEYINMDHVIVCIFFECLKLAPAIHLNGEISWFRLKAKLRSIEVDRVPHVAADRVVNVHTSANGDG